MKFAVFCVKRKSIYQNNRVFHKSALVKNAKVNILEFLLLNCFIVIGKSIAIYEISFYFLVLLNDNFINLQEL